VVFGKINYADLPWRGKRFLTTYEKLCNSGDGFPTGGLHAMVFSHTIGALALYECGAMKRHQSSVLP
jgi:hypothetical protein